MTKPDDRERIADEAREILDELDPDERRAALRLLREMFPDSFPLSDDHLSEA